MKKTALITLVLLAAAGGAAAHPGHPDTGSGVLAGLAHPLGLDHLLAMLAVGLWSATALPAGRRLHGPLAFLATLLAGAAVGAVTSAPSLVEPAIAASVLLFGLLIAAPRRLPGTAGLALVALAGALHGLAHGAELPAGGSPALYAMGFVTTTALLHAAGLALGHELRTLPQRLAGAAHAALGSGLGLAGLALLVRA